MYSGGVTSYLLSPQIQIYKLPPLSTIHLGGVNCYLLSSQIQIYKLLPLTPLQQTKPQKLQPPLRNENMASKRLETAKKYIDHFAILDTLTLESLLAENHHYQFALTSMNLLGPFDKQGFLAHSRRLRNIMAGFPVTGKEYIESESGNQVTVWATSRTIFTMDESGEKIVRTVEFLDSKGTVEKLGVLMKRANENREKRLVAEGK
jgi:hypothetical protein